VGNPNGGKTTLFNTLTGAHQKVGNWTGVTVQEKVGQYKKDKGVKIIDLPGIYSLKTSATDEFQTLKFLQKAQLKFSTPFQPFKLFALAQRMQTRKLC
jgi:ferrous iron transport protein B